MLKPYEVHMTVCITVYRDNRGYHDPIRNHRIDNWARYRKLWGYLSSLTQQVEVE